MESVITSAPGKVILFGEHAVVYGKTALATSLSNARAFIRVMKIPQQIIEMYAPCVGIPTKKTFNLSSFHDIAFSDLKNEEIQYPKVHQEVVEKLQQEVKEIPALACVYLFLYLRAMTNLNFGISLEMHSTIPIGAGLGSSAAFGVSLASALLSCFDIVSKQTDMKDVDGPFVNGKCITDIKISELINRWTYVVETLIHGTPSGIDNSVATFGGLLSLTNGEIARQGSVPSNVKILVVNTKVSRSTKALVSKVREYKNANPEIVDPMLDEMGKCSSTCIELFKKANKNEITSKELYDELAKLIDKNQKLLNQVGVGHEKLDEICKITSEFGYHSKLTGAGGGGCAFTLLPDDISNLENLKSKLVNAGFECFETQIGDFGLLFHSNEDFDKIKSLLN